MPTKVAKPLQEHVIQQTSAEPEKPDAPDLADVIPLFVASRSRKVATTLEKYRRELIGFLKWLKANDFPTDTWSLGGKRGGKYIVGYLEYQEGQGKAAGSQLTAYRCLKTFWRWAYEQSLNDDDEPGGPPYYVRRVPTSLPEVKIALPDDEVAEDIGEPYTEAEVERILEAIGSPRGDFWTLRDRALILLLSGSGLRRKEAAGLKVSDYHPADGSISVRRTVAKKTRAKDDSRTSKVYNGNMREINRYYMILTNERQQVKGRGRQNDPLFPSRNKGQHLSANAVGHMFVKIVQGIQSRCRKTADHEDGHGCDKCIRYGADLHRFRATWAIDMRLRGVSLDSVMKMGGWRSATMPMHYMEKARDKIARQDADRAMASGE